MNLRNKEQRDFMKENTTSSNSHDDSSDTNENQITGLFENKRMFRVWGYATFILFFICLFSSLVYFSHQLNIDNR